MGSVRFYTGVYKSDCRALGVEGFAQFFDIFVGLPVGDF